MCDTWIVNCKLLWHMSWIFCWSFTWSTGWIDCCRMVWAFGWSITGTFALITTFHGSWISTWVPAWIYKYLIFAWLFDWIYLWCGPFLSTWVPTWIFSCYFTWGIVRKFYGSLFSKFTFSMMGAPIWFCFGYDLSRCCS